jgi:hypothetical protein
MQDFDLARYVVERNRVEAELKEKARMLVATILGLAAILGIYIARDIAFWIFN